MQSMGIDAIIGQSNVMLKVKSLLARAAASEARVLISGENGTGKGLAAQAIHRDSARSALPFVEVNCAALPDTLLESELFGYEKGAFTGAFTKRKGRFEIANKGTLLLDEIGDLSASAQAKVLRVIQEGKVEPLGSEASIEVDVRIISATNKNLQAECKAGRFREDLLFRLDVIPVYLPPLRERKDDLALLLDYFMNSLGGAPKNLSIEKAAWDFLVAYSWPGNIRELRNLAERILVLRSSDCITESEIVDLLGKPVGAAGIRHLDENILFDLPYKKAKDAFEKEYLSFHFSKNNGIIAQTAKAIGIYPGNLYDKLKKYRIR